MANRSLKALRYSGSSHSFMDITKAHNFNQEDEKPSESDPDLKTKLEKKTFEELICFFAANPQLMCRDIFKYSTEE